jgi:hypothetical protein
MIDGVEFQADLVVLKTKCLDIILGMDWLRKHHGTISCSNKAITLIDHEGLKVDVSFGHAQHLRAILNKL